MSSDRSPSARADAYRNRVLQERRGVLEALSDSRRAQDAVLAEILETNGDTVFGREHGLAAVRNADEYRRATPIRGHEEFEPWLTRIHSGEKRVLTAEDPQAFFASSGTTGVEKTIPVTGGFLRRCFLPFYFAGFSQVVEHHPGLPARDDSVLNLWQDPHSRTGQTSGGRPHLGPSQLDYGKMGEELAVGLGNRAPWSELPEQFGDAGPWERTYLRLRLSAEHDVRGIIAINPAIAAALPYQLDHWWPRIVQEIRDGTLGGAPFRSPDPERAKALERAAERVGRLRPVDVWPRLELLLTWNTYVARLYLPALSEDYGPGARVRPAPIGSSEGPLAAPVDGRPVGGPLMVTSCFYEFIPADQEITPSSPTLMAHELERGQEYHVVVSHLGGLYRCAVRDIVRVIGFASGTPVVEYSCRNSLVSVAGERLRESHVLRAMANASAATGLTIRNLMFRALPEFDDVPGHEAAVAFGESPAEGALRSFASALDDGLRREASAYALVRGADGLTAPVVTAVRPETFWREWRRRVESGVRPPRVKDRVFVADPEVWARVTSPEGVAAGEGSMTRG